MKKRRMERGPPFIEVGGRTCLNLAFDLEPRGADPHVRAPFALEPAFDAGAKDRADVRVRPVPNWGAESDDPKHDLEQQHRGDRAAHSKAGGDEYSLRQSSSNLLS